MSDIIVGIDIGTSKISTVIGKVDRNNQIETAGRGIATFNGIKKGIIVDIESTSSAIRASLDQAESIASMKVGSAYVNIAGMHVSIAANSHSISIASDDRVIGRKDLEKLLYAVKDVAIPEDMQIIDVAPRQFIVDGYDEIVDPVGMVGVKLEVDADIIAGKITSVQNIIRSMEKAGVKIDGIVAEAFGTGEIVLTPDEKDMGVVMIDVGAGITDVSFFKNKRLVFYDSIPVGGDHITNDISIGLKIPYNEAERLKRQFELALTSLIQNDQTVSVRDVSDNSRKNLRVSEVVEIIEARVYEIFSLCRGMLQKAGIEGGYNAGVVLTGSGITYVDGGRQLASEVFGCGVRVASGNILGNLKPEYTAAAGIIKYISSSGSAKNRGSDVKARKQNTVKERNLFGKLSKFFEELF